MQQAAARWPRVGGPVPGVVLDAGRACDTGFHRAVRSCTHTAGVLRRWEYAMSKGMDRKKETKKKAAKTPQEKRAAKNEKKTSKPFAPT
ncbi:hypothetical protein GCM10027188_10810 [Lysobacter humi (ex Lee et al. 2017)]